MLNAPMVTSASSYTMFFSRFAAGVHQRQRANGAASLMTSFCGAPVIHHARSHFSKGRHGVDVIRSSPVVMEAPQMPVAPPPTPPAQVAPPTNGVTQPQVPGTQAPPQQGAPPPQGQVAQPNGVAQQQQQPGNGSSYVRLRGLPFSATEQEVAQWFASAPGSPQQARRVIFTYNTTGRKSGEAVSNPPQPPSRALQRQRQKQQP